MTMLKRFWLWLKSLVISTKAPIKPPTTKPDGGGGPGEDRR
jgi:hypothetical protein